MQSRKILFGVKTSCNTPGIYKHQVQLGLLVSQADYAIVLCYKTDAEMTRVSFDESRITKVRVDPDVYVCISRMFVGVPFVPRVRVCVLM